MKQQEHLSKDRELELGVLIQKRLKAVEDLSSEGLSQKEKAELQRIIAAGDTAIEELVSSNIGLVYNRALYFKSRFPGAPELEDLVQEGMIGLMTAVHKYDPARENKFSTVAYYWIIQAIIRGVNKTHRMVRLPENRISDYSRMVAVVNKYEESDLSSKELDEKIKEETGLSHTEILNIRNAASWHSSLNKKIGTDGNSKELIEIVGEKHHLTSAEFSATNNECFRLLSDSISQLPDLKKEIIAAHFNIQLNGEYIDSASLKEEKGLSPSKYRRLLAEGLKDVKAALSEKDLTLSDFLTP